MAASQIFHQKVTLEHRSGKRLAIFEVIVWKVPKSKDLKTFKPKEMFALIVGNEVSGVSPEAIKLTDEIVEIKMQGKKESFNAAVSTGIALYMLI